MGTRHLAPVESVCCLDCGKAYAKPTGGGTLSANPGCPYCGYVGWLPRDSFTEGAQHDRFGADRQQHRAAQSG